MKKYAIIIFILLCTTSYAQTTIEYPYLQEKHITERTIKGTINSSPITIYYSYFKVANYGSGAYSVKGWYYFDTVKTKTPLSGVFNGGLTLYAFNDPKKDSLVLNFEVMKKNHQEDMVFYKNLDSYEEKFVITYDEKYRSKNDKTVRLSLESTELGVDRIDNYLVINDSSFFDLAQLSSLYDGSFNVTYSIYLSRGNHVILDYEHASNPGNTMGECGMGTEVGFITLSFDDMDQCSSSHKFLLSSCIKGYDIGKIEEDKDKIVYIIQKFEKQIVYVITVDKELGVLSKKHD